MEAFGVGKYYGDVASAVGSDGSSAVNGVLGSDDCGDVASGEDADATVEW